jgi:hypothetical protein
MPREKITRRQKNIARLLKEKKGHIAEKIVFRKKKK